MNPKTILSILFLFASIGINFAQQNEECKTKLSISHVYTKANNYDSAYESWLFVKNECPKLSIAIYTDGEKILNHKIKKSEGIEKKEFIEDMLILWKKRSEYFGNKTPNGKYAAKACQLMYDNKEILEKTNEELYACFDATYKIDKKTFTHPKSLYTYFSLMVDLFDAGKKPEKELFNKHDDIVEKIEDEVKNYSSNLNELIIKEEEGALLTKTEKGHKRQYESYLLNYDLISKNIDSKVFIRTNCKNLIPLYTRDFDAHQNDSIWLKRAVNRMYYKKCTEDELYEKLVKAYDRVAPSAETKLYIVRILIKKGKISEIGKYLSEAYDLETVPFEKADLAHKIGLILKGEGKYSQARKYFRNSIKLNPSNGKPHLAIAVMYANSANDCGDTIFNKRAVYWLAAKEARKASRDPTLKKEAAQFVARYEAQAPSKEDIFKCACSGKVIKIGCWIRASVIVPKI